MYLSDSKIVELLPQLDIVTDMESRRFDPEVQIQPCSIDLTLSPVFWRERGKALVDLRHHNCRNFRQGTIGDKYVWRTMRQLLSSLVNCCWVAFPRSSLCRRVMRDTFRAEAVSCGWADGRLFRWVYQPRMARTHAAPISQSE